LTELELRLGAAYGRGSVFHHPRTGTRQSGKHRAAHSSPLLAYGGASAEDLMHGRAVHIFPRVGLRRRCARREFRAVSGPGSVGSRRSGGASMSSSSYVCASSSSRAGSVPVPKNPRGFSSYQARAGLAALAERRSFRLLWSIPPRFHLATRSSGGEVRPSRDARVVGGARRHPRDRHNSDATVPASHSPQPQGPALVRGYSKSYTRRKPAPTYGGRRWVSPSSGGHRKPRS